MVPCWFDQCKWNGPCLEVHKLCLYPGGPTWYCLIWYSHSIAGIGSRYGVWPCLAYPPSARCPHCHLCAFDVDYSFLIALCSDSRSRSSVSVLRALNSLQVTSIIAQIIGAKALHPFVEHPLLGVGSNMYRSINSLAKTQKAKWVTIPIYLFWLSLG